MRKRPYVMEENKTWKSLSMVWPLRRCSDCARKRPCQGFLAGHARCRSCQKVIETLRWSVWSGPETFKLSCDPTVSSLVFCHSDCHRTPGPLTSCFLGESSLWSRLLASRAGPGSIVAYCLRDSEYQWQWPPFVKDT